VHYVEMQIHADSKGNVALDDDDVTQVFVVGSGTVPKYAD